MPLLKQREEKLEGTDKYPCDPKELISNHWNGGLREQEVEVDPWEYSVLRLAQHYRSNLQDIDSSDLRLPARMMVVCAWILRLKVQKLEGRGEGEEEGGLGQEESALDQAFSDYQQFGEEDFLTPLEVPLKRIPRRARSKEELRKARQEAKAIYQEREASAGEVYEESEFTAWETDLDDGWGIKDRLDRFFQLIKDKVTQGRKVLFSALLEEDSEEERLSKFVQLLHLRSEGKVKCRQEEPFKEIEILLSERGS